jgi:hypothetical protein
LWRAGMPVAEVAAHLNRSIHSIHYRVAHLRLRRWGSLGKNTVGWAPQGIEEAERADASSRAFARQHHLVDRGLTRKYCHMSAGSWRCLRRFSERTGFASHATGSFKNASRGSGYVSPGFPFRTLMRKFPR